LDIFKKSISLSPFCHYFYFSDTNIKKPDYE
jgi:hypothetical protein